MEHPESVKDTEVDEADKTTKLTKALVKSLQKKYTLRRLKKELVYRPEILKLIVYLQKCLLRKKKTIKKIKSMLKLFSHHHHVKSCDASSQTDESLSCRTNENVPPDLSTDEWKLAACPSWDSNAEESGPALSLVDQVKEAAETALQQTGMVYESTSGMYYDYNTGYYYNAELGLYYHGTTGCYYYYDEMQKQYLFHSHADTSQFSTAPTYETEDRTEHSDKTKRRNKKVGTRDDDELIKHLSAGLRGLHLRGANHALESVVSQYPPCMRIIIQETSHNKLKVGSLFLLTKDGGTLGREGESHSVLIPEENVSRHHMTFKYDTEKSAYFAVDMGSRNGTILNGKRMSSAQQESSPIEVVHGSVIQLGSTKLLCHIHKGNSTCGHCEPGLLLRDSDAPQSVIYKPANIKTQHKKELRRLKTKYGVNPCKENDTAGENVLPEGYEDKAQKRREKVGSIHHGAKTEQTSLDMSIAPTNKGFKMLEKMGWAAGEGLGKDAQGNKEPVPIVSNLGKSGLGTAGARSATPLPPPPPAKNKMWLATKIRFDKLSTAPAPVFNDEDDIDEDI